MPYANIDPISAVDDSTTLTAIGTSVELGVFDSDELPSGLQRIVEAWELIAR